MDHVRYSRAFVVLFVVLLMLSYHYIECMSMHLNLNKHFVNAIVIVLS